MLTIIIKLAIDSLLLAIVAYPFVKNEIPGKHKFAFYKSWWNLSNEDYWDYHDKICKSFARSVFEENLMINGGVISAAIKSFAFVMFMVVIALSGVGIAYGHLIPALVFIGYNVLRAPALAFMCVRTEHYLQNPYKFSKLFTWY